MIVQFFGVLVSALIAVLDQLSRITVASGVTFPSLMFAYVIYNIAIHNFIN